MRNGALPVAFVFLLLTFSAGIGIGQASPSDQSSNAPIRLKTSTFVPTRGEAPSIPPGLAISGYATGERGYYLVQFRGPIEQAWKDQATAQGAELLDYVPDFAFKARMNPAEAARVSKLPDVVWVGLFHPAYKLSPGLVRGGTRLYDVQLERGADLGQVIAAVARTGAQLSRQGGNVLTLAADEAQIDALARVPDVAWIDNFRMWERLNDYAAGTILGSSAANAVHSNGLAYDGSTQKIAIADTGIGGGTASTAHRDIPASRIAAIYDWPGASSLLCYTVSSDGSQDVDSGHGTHVAGSALGSGGPNEEGRGVAPGASLVFQSVENYITFGLLCTGSNGYYLPGIPTDLHQLFQQSYNAGARIASNSWGGDVKGQYDSNSSNADDFIWNHKDMAIAFAAGNSGADANSDGVIDSDSIYSPATAKNVITVGASENDRRGNYPCDPGLSYGECALQSNQNVIATYGESWSYAANPLKDDPMAGGSEQMLALSSRGPTDDGRIKPDVVAPGTWVLSTYSPMYQQGYGTTNPRTGGYQYDGWGFPYNQYYKYMGGTSMATPLAAGGAAVVRDFYKKVYGTDASAALVKTTLVNSAVDMLDENNDGVDDNAFPIPNIHEGWGRIDLAGATDGKHLFYDETSGLATGSTRAYQFTVPEETQFKVSLAWTDYASAVGAAKNLVNDLDLELRSPSGVLYTGNNFSGGWSRTGESVDRTNNLENVYVQAPEVGSWTVTVHGYNVPNGPQPFALVVAGATAGNGLPTPTLTPTSTLGPSSTPTATTTVGPTPTMAPGSANLALAANGGSVVDFSTWAYIAGWEPANLIDGTDEAWSSLYYYVTNQYVTVQLAGGDVYTVDRIRLNPSDQHGMPVADDIKDFQIRVSTDGTTFTTALSATALQQNVLQEFTFPPVQARYVMLFGINNYGGDYMAATELEVYGPGGAPPTATYTSTPTQTETPTSTYTSTPLPTGTYTPTETPTLTPLPSYTPTWTTLPTSTWTPTPTLTMTPTATKAPTNSPTPTNTVAAKAIHVGALTPSSTLAGSYWKANVTILVVDSAGGPVRGATVTGTWSDGYAGSSSCVTKSNGQCLMSSGKIANTVTSATFTVTDMSRTGYVYDSSVNVSSYIVIVRQ